jgi:hypothetical protein
MYLTGTYNNAHIGKNLSDAISYTVWSETRGYFITIT